MRVSWFLSVLSVIGAVLLLFGVSAAVAEMVYNNGIDSTSDIATSRKIKEIIDGGNYGKKKRGMENEHLDDYQPVDPSPSSKVIRPGPIEHGAPLMPFIPKPPPAEPPEHGG